MWRFRNYGKKQIDSTLENRNIEPRLNQIMLPLASIVTDKTIQKSLIKFIEKRNEEIILERGSEFDAEVLESYMKLGVSQTNGGEIIIQEITIGEITNALNNTYGEKYGKKLHPKRIGSIISKKLGLETRRGSKGVVVTIDNRLKIILLARKFGLEIPSNTSQTDGNSKSREDEIKETEDNQNKIKELIVEKK